MADEDDDNDPFSFEGSPRGMAKKRTHLDFDQVDIDTPEKLNVAREQVLRKLRLEFRDEYASIREPDWKAENLGAGKVRISCRAEMVHHPDWVDPEA